MSQSFAVVFSCEHGGNEVPSACAQWFRGHRALLDSHRGFDAGALALARRWSEALNAPLVENRVTRLLVDTNRPEGHPRVFSEITRPRPAAERRVLLEVYHRPHWNRVQDVVRERLDRGERVVHLSVHSFAARLEGRVRNADLALLYDPGRARERAFCVAWLEALGERQPALRTRRNYPYRGVSAGLTTALRRVFPAARYLGIEVEANQGAMRTIEDAASDILGAMPRRLP